MNDILTEQLSEMSRSRDELLGGELPDAQQWFTETLTDMKESYGEYWEQITAETGHTGGKIDRLSGFVDFGTKRSQEVIIAKIPTAVISHDVLEFAAQPVRDRSAAIGLALEQYAFCNDIIDQGFQELCVLADTLTKSSVWSFWWD